MFTLLPTSLIFAGACFALYVFLFVGRRGRHFPPGPPTLPIIGNLHQIPRNGAHFKFTEWSKKYGGIFSIKLGTGTAIVVTDRRIVRQLLDKQSSVSSYRPVSHLSQKLITGGDHLLVMDYGVQWRSMRKLIVQEFTESLCEKQYVKIVNAEAVQLLRDMVSTPENFMQHPRRFSNSIIMSIVFGKRTPTTDTSHMIRLYELMEHWSKVMEIGATPPVDVFPFLKLIPERFLGNWVTRATQVKNEMDTLYYDVVESVIERRSKLGSRNSFMDRVLDKQEKLNLSKHQLYFLGGVAMEGGSDTAAAGILAFIKAMTCFQDVQKKAQVEIDGVMGEDQSPQWSDYAKLPYVSQIVKESMRWRPIGGLGVPHALSEDVWFEGMFLPKGSMLIWNAWGLHNDEAYVPNPDRFDPDRFAGRTLLAPEYASSNNYESRDHYNYGVGRRICPGIHLGERNLFTAMAKLLWAFSFEKATDANGRTLDPDLNYETGYSEGFIVCTKDFPSKITPRSRKRVETIMSEFELAESEVFSQYE